MTLTEYVPPPPSLIPALMKDFIKKNSAIRNNLHPVQYAAMTHIGFVDIHPFVDGNGRTARLLMNLALFQHGYSITIIPPVLRNEYINLIMGYQTKKRNKRDFINFISVMVYESSKDYLRLLKKLQD